MPSVNWIQFQLEPLLESPRYAHIIADLNKNRPSKTDPPYTPQSLAKNTAVSITHDRMLVHPVNVWELTGPAQLYRAHDGGDKASPFGRCWFSRELMENFWISTEGMGEGHNRRSHFRHLMRNCNLVKFEWNPMTHLSCMEIPPGENVPVVTGEGSWRAMLPKGGGRADDRRPAVLSKDLKRQLSNMAKEPTEQYVVALFDKAWVKPVTEGMPTWPLLS